MRSLDNDLWKLHISIPLVSYQSFLYGSECLMDTCRVDAVDQWCLRMLLGIKWHQYVGNDEVTR